MLMVVFGAGASYDSAPSLSIGLHTPSPFRPPLANQLFEDRYPFANIAKKYGRILPIIPQLRELNGRSVEEVLQQLQEEAKRYVEGQRQLMAVRYYLRDVLWECTKHWVTEARGVTNYRSLLDQIARQDQSEEPIALVTFNYDTLLEDALADYGFKAVNMDDYIASHRKYKLFKLHGSITWARFITRFPMRNLTHKEIIERATELEVGDIFTNYGDERRDMLNGTPLLPAIAIPLRSKDAFECPKSHVDVLREFIPRVTRILFIGWHAGESHFLRMLGAGLTSLDSFMVVAGKRDTAREIAFRIKNSLLCAAAKTDGIAGIEGFTEFITRREGDKFLRGEETGHAIGVGIQPV